MVDLAYLLAGLLLFPLLGSAASLFVRTRPGAHWPVIISLGLSWLCAAAALVLLFGLGLLFGYVAAERATCL